MLLNQECSYKNRFRLDPFFFQEEEVSIKDGFYMYKKEDFMEEIL